MTSLYVTTRSSAVAAKGNSESGLMRNDKEGNRSSLSCASVLGFKKCFLTKGSHAF